MLPKPPSVRKEQRHPWPCIALLALLAGCAGTLEDPERFITDAGHAVADAGCGDRVVAEIFPTSCGGASCHQGSQPSAGLDLVSPNVAARLVDVPGSSCGGRPLIDSANPVDSALLDRLLPEPECGLRMPRALPPLSAEDTACVAQWVQAVATSSTSTAALGASGLEGGR